MTFAIGAKCEIAIAYNIRAFNIIFATQVNESHTFGFPVVPDEKHKNASLVLASPGSNLFSTKVESIILKPCFTTSSMVRWLRARIEGDLPSKSMIDSAERPYDCAAESAVSNVSGP